MGNNGGSKRGILNCLRNVEKLRPSANTSHNSKPSKEILPQISNAACQAMKINS
jgi:hypothetical protein